MAIYDFFKKLTAGAGVWGVALESNVAGTDGK